MAVAGPGDEVIVPRNAHKSLLAGLILGGALPVYVEPTVDDDWQVAVNVPLEAFVAAIEAHPRARAVFVTSPSYNGFCADVPGLAAAAHAAGLPLDVDRLRTMVTMLRTTSPLAAIYLSIDAARRQMVEGGEALWGEALRLAALARTRLAATTGIVVLDRDDALRSGSVDFDPVRLTISAADLDLAGYELERRLRADHAVAVEAADAHNIVANITFGDSAGTVDRLVVALETIAADADAGLAERTRARAAAGGAPEAGGGKKAASAASPTLPFFTRLACSPREAFFGPAEALPLSACVGRVSAEMVVPYPPGIPVLGPGEEISAETVGYLAAAARGALVQGPRDLSLATLRVVTRPG